MKNTLKRSRLLLPILILVMLCGCSNPAAVYGKDTSKITVEAGQTFTLRLDENPTTGYMWTVNIADDIVKLETDSYIQKSNDPHLVGGGGQRILTFKGIKPGKTTITMNYERSFEENSSIETRIFAVTVE